MIALTVASAEPSRRISPGWLSPTCRSVSASAVASNGSGHDTFSMNALSETCQPASLEMTTLVFPYASWNARARE